MPFTKAELQDSVVTVLLTAVRQLHFLFPDCRRQQLELLRLPVEDDVLASINDPDCSPQHLGLTYQHVAGSGLADAMDRLYDFAFAGLLDLGIEDGDMNSEGGASWCSRILHDLAGSEFVKEWDEYSKCREAITRCLLVCETAHARRVLEGMEDNFMDWDGPGLDGLSMRQLSLLANMTEPSLRTMANPKRKHPLATQTDGRNAYVVPADARDWLKAKGRYLPIQRINREGRLDLTAQRFKDLDSLQIALQQRSQHLASTLGEAFESRVRGIRGVKLDLSNADYPSIWIPDAVLLDPQQARTLAAALELPAELLALRAMEAHANEMLVKSQHDIQKLLSR